MDNRQMIEEHLALAERHIREGDIQLSRQRRVIQELERDGHLLAAVNAQGLLDEFEQLQRMHVADRDRLMAELAALR